MKNSIIAFTGHRQPRLCDWKDKDSFLNIKNQIKKSLIDLKPKKVISGMAQGVDQIAANISLELKTPLIAAIPFKGQDNRWPEKIKNKYQEILNQCELVHCTDPNDGANMYEKFHIRDKWMVDNCDILIAVYDGIKNGGTYSTFKYANEINKPILWIKIPDLEIEKVNFNNYLF